MLCIYNPSTEPYFNLAAEEYFLDSCQEDVFMLWRNEPAIIVGKFQNSLAEINLDYVQEKHIKVVRRQTGGGAVFHDLGNLNFTFIENDSNGNFQTFTEPILKVLNQLGVDARFEGRNDLTINGMKFSGNAQCFRDDQFVTGFEGEPLEVSGQGGEVRAEKGDEYQRAPAGQEFYRHESEGCHHAICEIHERQCGKL